MNGYCAVKFHALARKAEEHWSRRQLQQKPVIEASEKRPA
jgi:hypothetical protein